MISNAVQFGDLPSEVHDHILSYCSKEDASNVSLTAKRFLPMFSLKMVREGLNNFREHKVELIESQYQGFSQRLEQGRDTPIATVVVVLAISGVFMLSGVTYLFKRDCPIDACSSDIEYHNLLVNGVFWLGTSVLSTLPLIGSTKSCQMRFFQWMKNSGVKRVEQDEKKLFQIMSLRLPHASTE